MESKEYKDTLREIIDYLEKFEKWLSRIPVKPEDEQGKKELLSQAREGIKKFNEELDRLSNK